jgi:hypothetical protein
MLTCWGFPTTFFLKGLVEATYIIEELYDCFEESY